jgi:hypothetical protein
LARQLFASYSLLAGLAESRDNAADAARYYEKLVQVWEKELAPSNVSGSMMLAMAQEYQRHALFLVRSGQPAAALPALKEAERLLVKLGPAARFELYNFACIRAQLSTLIGVDRPELTHEAQAERKRYAEQAMTDLKMFYRSGGIKGSALLTKEPALQPLAEREDFKALVAERETLEKAVKDNSERTARAIKLGRAGEYTRAVEEIQPVLVSKFATRYDYYNSACVYALAAAAKDDKLAADEQLMVSLQYADRAMELLRQAVRMGLRTQLEVNRIRTDPDLKSLRLRDDFKKLLADLGTPPQVPVDSEKQP